MQRNHNNSSKFKSLLRILMDLNHWLIYKTVSEDASSRDVGKLQLQNGRLFGKNEAFFEAPPISRKRGGLLRACFET